MEETTPLTGDSYNSSSSSRPHKSQERNKVTTMTSGGSNSGRLDDFEKWGGRATNSIDPNEGIHKTIAREAIGKVKEFINKAKNFDDSSDFG